MTLQFLFGTPQTPSLSPGLHLLQTVNYLQCQKRGRLVLWRRTRCYTPPKKLLHGRSERNGHDRYMSEEDLRFEVDISGLFTVMYVPRWDAVRASWSD